MKNEQEINNQMEILKSLDLELDKYEQKVDELITTKDLEESLRKCSPKKRAEIYWTAAYGIYTNKYMELLLDEKDPELHPLYKEIQRLNTFRKKLIEADKESKNNEQNNEESKDDINLNKNDNIKKKKKVNIYKEIKKIHEQNKFKDNN